MRSPLALAFALASMPVGPSMPTPGSSPVPPSLDALDTAERTRRPRRRPVAHAADEIVPAKTLRRRQRRRAAAQLTRNAGKAGRK